MQQVPPRDHDVAKRERTFAVGVAADHVGAAQLFLTQNCPSTSARDWRGTKKGRPVNGASHMRAQTTILPVEIKGVLTLGEDIQRALVSLLIHTGETLCGLGLKVMAACCF
jgi:hypothetical protein